MIARTLLVLAAAVAASGCASLRNPPAPVTEIDMDYVAMVENNASRLGTKVYWVQYPTRPVQTAAAEPAKK
jgi:hypothetical protein